MPNAIKSVYSSVNTLTISLASLASSTDGKIARQSTIVDNSTTKYSRIYVYPKIKLGTTPTVAKLVYFWIIRSDGTNRTDGAGSSDASLTIKNAELICTAITTATTGENIQPHIIIENPGKEWGIAIGHDSVAALDSTGGNHVINWLGENPEIQ